MGVRLAEQPQTGVRPVDGGESPPLSGGARRHQARGVRRVESTSPRNMAAAFLSGVNELVVEKPWAARMEALRVLGIVDEDKVSPWLADKFGANYEPKTDGERAAQAGGREFVNNIAALVPQYRGAQLLSQAAKPAASLTERVRASVLEYVQKNPWATAFFEQLGATGAGVGSQIGRDKFPDNPAAETIGGIVGGAGLPTAVQLATKTPAAAIVRTGKRVVEDNFSTQAGRESVGKAIAGSIDNRTASNMIESEGVMSRLGVQERPSIAEATASPNLLRNQRAIETEASGDALNMLTWRKMEAADQIIHNQVRPEFTGKEPSVVFNASRERVLAAQERLAREQAGVANAQVGVTNRLQPVDRVEVGRTIRQARKDARKEVTDFYEQQANASGINDPSVEFEFDGFRNQIRDRFFNPRSRFAETSKSPLLRRIAGLKPVSAEVPAGPQSAVTGGDNAALERGLQQEIAGFKAPSGMVAEGGVARPVTFEDLKAIRQDVGDEIAVAAAAGDRGRVRELVEFQKMFDEYFENIDPTSGSPELVQSWREFRGNYKRDVFDRFDRGAAYEIGRVGRRREFVIQDEAVASSFLSNETSARQFNEMFRGDEGATAAMRSAILDEARTAAVRDGRVDRNALESYLRRRGKVLDEFPDVKRELENISSATRALSARESALTNRARVIERSELAKALNAPVDEIIPRALRNPTLMREVANTARRTGNEKALIASVWEQAMGNIDATNPLPDPKQLLSWINMNERTLRMALPADHLRAIRDVYKGLEIIGRTPLPQGAPEAIGALDKMERFAGTSVSQMASRVFAAESGRVSYRYNAVDALARFANRLTKRQFNKVMAQALFDPELAKDLANMQRVKEISPAQLRRMNGWLFTLGLPNLEEENGN